MKTTEHVEYLLRQGKKPRELLALGFPKKVVTRVRRQLRQEKAVQQGEAPKGRGEAKGQRVSKEIKDAGGDAIFIEVDVSKVDDMKRMIKTTVETYGKLNILYNHAGSTGPKGVEDVTEEEWEQCIKANMLGSFFATKFAVPEMRKAGGGSVLFTASTAGLIGSRFSPTYSSAKGGIVLLTKSLALRLAKDNIRVNCICPSLADTPMGPDFVRATPDEDWATTEVTIERFVTTYIPLGRMVKPQEIAYGALFLASDEASFITGIFLPVDGGATAM